VCLQSVLICIFCVAFLHGFVSWLVRDVTLMSWLREMLPLLSDETLLNVLVTVCWFGKQACPKSLAPFPITADGKMSSLIVCKSLLG